MAPHLSFGGPSAAQTHQRASGPFCDAIRVGRKRLCPAPGARRLSRLSQEGRRRRVRELQA
eukprot:4956846-Pyramimonas_sp.AAC.1